MSARPKPIPTAKNQQNRPDVTTNRQIANMDCLPTGPGKDILDTAASIAAARRIAEMKFQEKLISLRKQKGLSQEELGLELHVSRQTVSKWESGGSLR